MGALDNVKKTLSEVGEKAADGIKDGADRLHDKAREVRADARVAAAEAEREGVVTTNEIKEEHRSEEK